MNIFKAFPETNVLIEKWSSEKNADDLLVNAHIHTPYSFSAFSRIDQIFRLATEEGVKVVGINDFNTGDGFPEFLEKAETNDIFPLFNIEFIGLIKEFQKTGVRVNDPNNPGRIYFSGKGLKNPFSLNDSNKKLLNEVLNESQEQIKQMLDKVNAHLLKTGMDFSISYEEIKKMYAREQVRERHIAKALAVHVAEKSEGNYLVANDILTKIFDGNHPKSEVHNHVAVENEIRTRFLKKGGFAFVPENDSSFMSLEKIIEIIIDAGGIPCYPVLLDDANGNFTDFESDWERMHEFLSNYKVKCIELIPNRNSIEVLEKFVRFFDEKAYIISFGTEHNSPEIIPINPECTNSTAMSDFLRKVNLKSASVIAAHQYLMAVDKKGFLNTDNTCRSEEMEYFKDLGKAVLNYYFRKKK